MGFFQDSLAIWKDASRLELSFGQDTGFIYQVELTQVRKTKRETHGSMRVLLLAAIDVSVSM